LKKLFILLTVLMLVIGLVGCSSSKEATSARVVETPTPETPEPYETIHYAYIYTVGTSVYAAWSNQLAHYESINLGGKWQTTGCIAGEEGALWGGPALICGDYILRKVDQELNSIRKIKEQYGIK
jgi:hypothetical protein